MIDGGCTVKDFIILQQPFASYLPKKMHTTYLTDLKQVQKDSLYFQFPRLSLNRHLTHGVFTRHGGVSSPPFNSLNISFSVNDRSKDVTTNIRKIKNIIGAKDLIHIHQTHSNGILVLKQRHTDIPHTDSSADAMVTNMPQVGLLVKQADCQATIIYDPEKHVLANVHCGWRGNVKNILENVVTQMEQTFGCKASGLQAAIGPSLGPCCAEFINYKDIFPEEFEQFMVRKDYFNLWAASCWQLENAGLRAENIEVAGICNCCRTDLFYSYRAERHTGRFGTVAMLR